MSFSESTARTLLGPALEAARRALRRLDAKEVPADLSKVASYTSGKLPPPLAKKLIQALDSDPWLRSKAVDEFSDADLGSERPSIAASTLFLARPFGWWDPLARLGLEAEQSTADSESEALRSQVRELRAGLDEAKRRDKILRGQLSDAAKEGRAIERDLRKQLSAGRESDHGESARHAAEASAAAERAEAAEADALDAARAAAGLRESLRKVRRERADLERRLHATTAKSTSARPKPLDLARALDEAAAQARPLVEVPATADRPQSTLRLPGGVRPDRAEAVDWLIAQPEPFTMIVDGYNVSFLLSEKGFASKTARTRLNLELARLRARPSAMDRLVVVYDSSVEGRQSAAQQGGVEVVFAPGDRLADEEVIAMAAATVGPVVVASTDREVRDGAEQVGAVVLWSQALVGWLRRPS